ncbi:MAG: hypothetical protein CMK09_06450 [Ponticaulis sp.]|nr:hypothetical protein [Ponticaulis sp.]|tara:strand:- start:9721 stop:11109 length:1389 start_codon:yes stop_codon:yes gene_type:complete
MSDNDTNRMKDTTGLTFGVPSEDLQPEKSVPRAFARADLTEGGFQLMDRNHEVPLSEGRVVALVDGIEIGSSKKGWSPKKERLSVVCHYFPRVDLPVEVRFTTDDQSVDVAPSITLRSPGDVVLLVGYGTIDDVEIRISNGVIKGEGINRRSAFAQPSIICRVNGAVHREVDVEAGNPLVNGGIQVHFSARIEPSDFRESGALYEFQTLPNLETIAVRSFSANSIDETAIARLVRLEETFDQLSRRMSSGLSFLESRFELEALKTTQVINDLGEYLLTLVYDQLNQKNLESDRSEELSGAIGGFHQKMREARQEVGVGEAPTLRVLKPESPAFVSGWHKPEVSGDGVEFRWMTQRGGIHQPYPEELVDEITIECVTSFQPTVFPIHVLLDGRKVDAEVLPDTKSEPFLVKVALEKPTRFYRLDIFASDAKSPHEIAGSADRRVLSLAVGAIVLGYKQDQKGM